MLEVKCGDYSLIIYRESLTPADFQVSKNSRFFTVIWFMYGMNNNKNNKGETWSVFMRMFANFQNNYAPEDLWITISIILLSLWQVTLIDDAMP